MPRSLLDVGLSFPTTHSTQHTSHEQTNKEKKVVVDDRSGVQSKVINPQKYVEAKRT
jgi:hypothetical protein